MFDNPILEESWINSMKDRTFPKEFREYFREGVSQHGEAGILDEITRRMGIDKGVHVELGGSDGKLFSNTYDLLQRGWKGYYIEGDRELASKLHENLKGLDYKCLERRVSCEAGSTLDDLLDEMEATEIDILSLDIDGFDYWVWKSLKRQPKLVIVETNDTFKGAVTAPYDPNYSWEIHSLFFGASTEAWMGLAEQKGYYPIGRIALNSVFVRNDCDAGFPQIDLRTLPVDQGVVNLTEENLAGVTQDMFVEVDPPSGKSIPPSEHRFPRMPDASAKPTTLVEEDKPNIFGYLHRYGDRLIRWVVSWRN